ncbi:hypothetical protein L1887_29191 [Cichorium endivia]|nr:hypothetical protein L1887_29191 [Cichorium endivia]
MENGTRVLKVSKWKMIKPNEGQRKRCEKDRRNRDQDFKEPEIDANRDINHLEKRKSARKVKDFDAVKSLYSQEFTFCEKVKDRLRNSDDDYQALLKCLHIYSTEIITRKELQSLVSDLLGKHADLMDGFSAFLERCENIGGQAFEAYVGLLLVKSAVVGVVSEWQVVTCGILLIIMTVGNLTKTVNTLVSKSQLKVRIKKDECKNDLLSS